MLGRSVNPTLHTPEDFVEKVRGDNHIVTRVLNQPKILLIGKAEDKQLISEVIKVAGELEVAVKALGPVIP